MKTPKTSKEDWLNSGDPEFLFSTGKEIISRRQKYLWAIACIRSAIQLFREPEVTDLLNAAEISIDDPNNENALSLWASATTSVRLLSGVRRTRLTLWLPIYAAGIGSEPDWHAVHTILNSYTTVNTEWIEVLCGRLNFFMILLEILIIYFLLRYRTKGGKPLRYIN